MEGGFGRAEAQVKATSTAPSLLHVLPGLNLTFFQQVSDVSLVPVSYTNFPFISQEGLLLWVID